MLHLCMDRPDVALPLVPILQAGGPLAVGRRWTGFVREAVAC